MIDAFRLVAANKGIVIAADKLGKAKTLVTDMALPLLIAAIHTYVNIAGLALLGAATALTIWSGLNYVIGNKAVLRDREAVSVQTEKDGSDSEER